VTKTRRQFLGASLGAATLAALRPWQLEAASASPATRATLSRAAALPASGADAPFDRVVFLMMENRSFDHLLGWLPGADGRQAGLAYTDTAGVTYPTFRLSPDFQGCDAADPDHSFEGGSTQRNGGACDGFLKTQPVGDQFPIGYYDEADVGVRGQLARGFTVVDNYFCSIMAETFPNRFYQHCARTDRNHNDGVTQVPDPGKLPAIWDQLNKTAGGPTGNYYFSDLSFLGLFGTKYQSISKPVSTFLAQAAAGALPNVSFVDPSFGGEGQGTSGDDHPRGDLRSGESFISEIYQAVRTGPQWGKTVFVIAYDEWGGFFDHVAPPRVADDTTGPQFRAKGEDPGNPDYGQLGFRVPCFVISPFAPARVSGGGAPYDHTSVLKMIEWRWGLQPLTLRDASARNLAEVLDLRAPRTDLPTIAAVVPHVGLACSPASTPLPHPAPVPPSAAVPEVPLPALLPVTAAVAGAAVLARHRAPAADRDADALAGPG